jgi:hypothetical protein
MRSCNFDAVGCIGICFCFGVFPKFHSPISRKVAYGGSVKICLHVALGYLLLPREFNKIIIIDSKVISESPQKV